MTAEEPERPALEKQYNVAGRQKQLAVPEMQLQLVASPLPPLLLQMRLGMPVMQG
jgi:hypothetical protein